MRRKPKSTKRFIFFIVLAGVGLIIAAIPIISKLFLSTVPLEAMQLKSPEATIETVQQVATIVYETAQKLIGLATGALGIALAFKELKD